MKIGININYRCNPYLVSLLALSDIISKIVINDCICICICITCRSAPLRSCRVVVDQRAALRKALLELRRTAGGTRYGMRGPDGVLSMLEIDKLVKNVIRFNQKMMVGY